jgi:arsenical pump membrane protein
VAAFRIILLAAGVAGALLRPWRWPAWIAPVLCAVVVVVAGGISLTLARRALHPLVSPIAFLLAAVPLAVLLDRLGFFATLAERVTRRGGGSGRLWVLAAVVTTALSLDAAVVLLTPLYVRIARRSGRNPVVLAFQPVLLASLASSALPVSNLTNLIAASWTGASTLAFMEHLAVPSLVASTVGWWCYRRFLHPDQLVVGPAPPAMDPPAIDPDRALAVGGVVVALVVIGFLGGRSIGVPPWAVAATADVVLLVVVRQAPWRAIPWQTALIVAGLGVLAGAAVTNLSIGRVIGGHGALALARTAGASGVAANVINNLPALLIALPAVGHQASPVLWAVLVGVNLGPVILVTGSLASLLWLDAVGRLGVAVTAKEFTRVGVRVGLPAALAGGVVALALLSLR